MRGESYLLLWRCFILLSFYIIRSLGLWKCGIMRPSFSFSILMQWHNICIFQSTHPTCNWLHLHLASWLLSSIQYSLASHPYNMYNIDMCFLCYRSFCVRFSLNILYNVNVTYHQNSSITSRLDIYLQRDKYLKWICNIVAKFIQFYDGC